MSELSDAVDKLVTDAQAVQTSVALQAPSLADNVLAAVLPVLTAAGYTAPVVNVLVTEVETAAEDATDTSTEA